MSSTLTELAEEFWSWRAATQPASSDDIVRVERPPGWVNDWSPGAVEARRRDLAAFAERYQRLDLAAEPVAVQVDGRLIGSALARVRYELELLRGWQRDPGFYLQQSLGPLFEVLLVPPPLDEGRVADVLRHLGQVPVVLEHARQHLEGHAVAAFARYAGLLVDRAVKELDRAMRALAPLLPAVPAEALLSLTGRAVAALAAYGEWLGERTAGFAQDVSAGPEVLGFFLHRVALCPDPADRLRAQARQEYGRAVALEQLLRARHRGAAPQPMIAGVEQEERDEAAIRAFYEEHGLLSQPESLRRYLFAPMPAYLEPLTWLGVAHYTGSAGEDALRYIEEPRDGLAYFEHAKAVDPRTAIVHEGVHAQQLALSWRHPRPIRRHYYDSLPSEGIAFYNEELMLSCGLFDDSAAGALFIANAQRLRALRVEVDLGLALGDLTLDQAADLLAETVPMDRETAWHEAAFFAGNPGQGLSYLVGKLQITGLLADCVQASGDAFDLRAFHDRLWLEGNVPLALQRWELLGLRDHLDAADALAGEAA